MPRKPRILAPGGFYHVIMRGNSRQDIFFDEGDRLLWQNLIHKGLNRYQHRIHAYCWMTNHVHMLAQAGVEPLGDFISFVGSNYARKVNLRRGQSGHLFERRYRSILVQEDNYLQELVRYIHLNPIRAGIVASLNDYKWSSHHAYMGSTPPDWLTLNTVRSFFGQSIAQFSRQYTFFMDTSQPISIVQLFRSGNDEDPRMLGDDDWRKSVLDESDSREDKPSVEQFILYYCSKHGLRQSDLCSKSRNRKMAAIRADLALTAVENRIATISELAKHLGRSQPALSKAINKLIETRQKL